MKLITKEIARKLPPLYANENKAPEQVPVVVKFFNPCGTGTWYITEGNLETGELFGLCDLGEPELGYVSLFFFLKYIAGSAGPYNEINEDLHLEMCNFRQSDYCMNPGAHAACFVPRGFLKSTIMTHGGATWELLSLIHI